MLSDNRACAGRFLLEEYKPKPYDNSKIRPCKVEATLILDKLHAITENITKHDDSLFTVDRKLKTGLNCLHNFKKEKRHYIKSSVRKDVLHLVEDLGRVMAKYKATYQIGIKSTTSETRKRKTRRKRGSSQLVKTVGKKHALFSVPWEEPPLLRVLVLTVSNGKQLIVKTYIFFASTTDKACLRDLCRANCFASEAQEIIWDFCT